MRPSEVFEKNRPLIRALAASHKTANPRIFGSVLHGTDREGSDLDILVDVLPGATMLDLGGLQERLTAALGVPVQIVTPEELGRRFRDRVMAEAQPV